MAREETQKRKGKEQWWVWGGSSVSQPHPTPLPRLGDGRGAGMRCEHQNPAQMRDSWIKTQEHVPVLHGGQRGN